VTLQYFSGYFAEAEQRVLLGELRSIVAAAPLFTPTTPRRVTKTNAQSDGKSSLAAFGAS
jgi:hypothetical protein